GEVLRVHRLVVVADGYLASEEAQSHGRLDGSSILRQRNRTDDHAARRRTSERSASAIRSKTTTGDEPQRDSATLPDTPKEQNPKAEAGVEQDESCEYDQQQAGHDAGDQDGQDQQEERDDTEQQGQAAASEQRPHRGPGPGRNRIGLAHRVTLPFLKSSYGTWLVSHKSDQGLIPPRTRGPYVFLTWVEELK